MLAGVGMGNMMGSLFGTAMIGGFNFAADTLVSQAAGAKEYELCGVVLNRARAFIVALFLPLSMLFIAHISHKLRTYILIVFPLVQYFRLHQRSDNAYIYV